MQQPSSSIFLLYYVIHRRQVKMLLSEMCKASGSTFPLGNKCNFREVTLVLCFLSLLTRMLVNEIFK